MKILKAIIPFFIIIALSYWAVLPLFSPGFFPIHDNTQIARVFEMTQSLKDGVFPVRWVSNLGYGYGYPIFNFYAPFSYYVGSTFQLLGFDALSATKLMMGMGIVLSAISMYFLSREFWGKYPAIVSSIFYLYAPFHAVDIYVRGDIAEFWAYAFLPLPFYGLYKVYKSKGNFKWIIVASLGYAGIIISHNLTAMMLSPFLLAFGFLISWKLFKRKNKKVIYAISLSLFLGLLLSAFYFIPALTEQRFTNILSQIGGGADYKDHFVCLYQLWQSQWGFGGSAPGCLDGLSFMAGKAHLLFSLLGLFLGLILFKARERLANEIRAYFIAFVFFSFCIFLMLPESKFLWDYVPLMEYFQYPWRFLLLVSFFSSFMAGGVIYFIQNIVPVKKASMLISFGVIVIVVFLNAKFFIPQYTFLTTASDFTEKEILRWETSKISDEYMPKDFPKPQDKVDVINDKFSYNRDEVVILSRKETSNMMEVKINALKPTRVHLNIAYFPAWKLTVDGKSRGSIVSKGYDVALLQGKHLIRMEFVQTNVERISNTLTILGIFIIFIGIIFWNKKFLNE